MQFNLNLLSSKAGLEQNCYQFNQANMTTAAQDRVSSKELTENVWKQRSAIQEALTDLTRSALILGKEKLHQNLDVDARITIQFDDTMFSDEESERMRFMQEISAGIRQKWEYRVKYDGEDEETARRMTGETENPQSESIETMPTSKQALRARETALRAFLSTTEVAYGTDTKVPARMH